METILLIENDAATLVARSLILRCFGYTVLEADSRGEAWSVCGGHQGTIRLTMMEASFRCRQPAWRLCGKTRFNCAGACTAAYQTEYWLACPC